jgi:serine/threonine protein kinase/WD40 repeat protein
MSSDHDDATSDSGTPPKDVLESFLAACDAGDVAKQAEILECHPECARELVSFRENDHELDAAVIMSARDDFPFEGRFFGSYRVIRRVHHGPLGTLFEARSDGIEGRVALKILNCRAEVSVQQSQRFVNEISALKEFCHPNIVRALDSGEYAEHPYFTMPWIDGADLRSIIDGLRAPGPGIDLPTHVHAEGQSGRLGWSDSNSHVLAVALIGIQAADALWHAHSVGLDGRAVLHRDIKPSNIMLDRAGRVFLIDFGLSRWDRGETLTESHALVGTLQYMAPERLIGNSGPRSDLYSLGLVLYELLTLRKPFDERANPAELLEKIKLSRPADLRSAQPKVPKGLARVVMHAIEKEPAHRYPSAKALADDLRRFASGERVPRRSPRFDQRVRAWAWRNPGISIATSTAIAGCILALIAVVRFLDTQAQLAEAKVASALDRERESQFRSLGSEIDLSLGKVHDFGWRRKIDGLVDRAAAIRGGADLRDLIVSTLVGEDLEFEFKIDDFSSSSVAFDQSGDRLALGGLNKAADGKESKPARVVDVKSRRVSHVSKVLGAGEVVFDRQNRALQFSVIADGKAIVWDIEKDQAVTSCDFPSDWKATASAISGDGSVVALAMLSGPETGEVRAWGVSDGKMRLRYGRVASALAFTPDGSLLADGDRAGRIEVREINSAQMVAELFDRHHLVLGMAFGRNPVSDAKGRHGWLLAEGGDGTARIWDLDRKQIHVNCENPTRLMSTFSFAPDATLLAGGGDGLVIWDVSTGQLVITGNPDGRKIFGTAFSRRNSRFAAALHHLQTGAGSCRVWRLSNGRGLMRLRGLEQLGDPPRFAGNRNIVFAQSPDLRVAAWDLDSGHLRFVREPSVRRRSYNSGVQSSPTGDRLVFFTGDIIELWDGTTGRELMRWKLNQALFDSFAFPSSGGILSIRLETRGGSREPFGNKDPSDPNVWRIRELRETGASPVLGEISGHEGRVAGAALKAEGDLFLVIGDRNDLHDGKRLVLTAYDLASRRRLWTIDDKDSDVQFPIIDPSWKMAAVRFQNESQFRVFDAVTGRRLESGPKSNGLS